MVDHLTPCSQVRHCQYMRGEGSVENPLMEESEDEELEYVTDQSVGRLGSDLGSLFVHVPVPGPFPVEETTKGKGKGREASRLTCFVCGREDHFKRDCPYRGRPEVRALARRLRRGSEVLGRQRASGPSVTSSRWEDNESSLLIGTNIYLLGFQVRRLLDMRLCPTGQR